jgi:enolase
MKIQFIDAYEILDSRGNPTVEVKVTMEDGTSAKASVPSGASTGSREACELRDNDEKRYGGKGVLKACKNVREKIMPAIKGFDAMDQEKIDRTMIELDGTENKTKLGANAILAVSLAVARVGAKYSHMPLWAYLRNSLGFEGDPSSYDFPIPLFNVINGGAHSDSGMNIQEYMVIPSGISGFAERLRAGSEIYHALMKDLAAQGFRVAVGDEGGFAPNLSSNEEPLMRIAQAVGQTSYKFGEEIFTGIDAAASEFFDKKSKKYDMTLDKKKLSSEELGETYQRWIEDYKMELIEDPMSEFDWEGWGKFNADAGDKVVIVGDDLTVTNTKILQEAYKKKACNSVLVKVNQIGTLTEAANCIKLARKYDMKVVISHRSGETEDSFISDLAVACYADYIKFGAPARIERVVKYNRVAKIERKKEDVDL